ncbi:sulfurtransferase [Serinibacter arcticus]|uniref:Sulfurtransferase n=2 Tax=Serinibacter arcticus TaxID=1655435 RepID=A0A2U1ZZQ1_9MICO|nr:sulfurtransferase [Serinibacter arcticus]
MRLDLVRRVGVVGAETTAGSDGEGALGDHAGIADERPADGAGGRRDGGAHAPVSARERVFIDVDAAHDLIWSEHPPVVLDVRWALGQTDGSAVYVRGHLPGAVYVDLDAELASTPSPEEGRHPLPTAEDLQATARRWGIDDGSTVLVYDDTGGTSAARAWWLLRWAGVADVRIVDGGLRAWVGAGHHLEDGFVRPRPGAVVVRPGGLATVTADEVADYPGVLLDARDHERFTGAVEPVDPRAGHVPGARSAPTRGNLTLDGWLLEPEDLVARFAGLEVRPGVDVAVYCGSGVTAAHQVAVLASIGVEAALYPGSFSQWANDPEREVATGD